MELVIDMVTLSAVVSSAISLAWYVRGLQSRVEKLEEVVASYE